MTVADAVGAPVLSAEAVVLRRASEEHLSSVQVPGADGLFAMDWTPLPLMPDDNSAGATSWVALGSEATPDLDALIAALDDGTPAPSVVLAYQPAGDATADAGAMAADGLASAERVLKLLQDWLAEPQLADTRLAVVTRGAVPADEGGSVDVSGAALWGLVRSAQAENPGRFLLLDLEPNTPVADHGSVLNAVQRAVETDESQVALRAGRVLAPRLVRAAGSGGDGDLVPPAGQPAWRLGAVGAATVDSVRLVPCPEALEPLRAGQVRIAVHAAGVNFRDALIVLGMYPGDAVFAGSEGAGVVLETGPEVTGLAMGDRVMGLFEGAFGPLAVADARTVVPIPSGWTFQQAAAAPVVFLTAWYGLVELGGLRAGESVLIHAATGGVGYGGRADRPPPGCRGVRHGEPWQAHDAGGHGHRPGAPGLVTRSRVRAGRTGGHRRPWRGRGTEQPGRALRGRLPGAAGRRRPVARRWGRRTSVIRSGSRPSTPGCGTGVRPGRRCRAGAYRPDAARVERVVRVG